MLCGHEDEQNWLLRSSFFPSIKQRDFYLPHIRCYGNTAVIPQFRHAKVFDIGDFEIWEPLFLKPGVNEFDCRRSLEARAVKILTFFPSLIQSRTRSTIGMIGFPI